MRKLALLFCLMTTTLALAADVKLDALKKGDVVEGFRVDAVYLNDAGKPLGARFLHQRSGFTLDYLQIESVPQGYTWVNSIPVGDQGEPHTQEHLLLGKGTTGRAFSGLDTMWLSGSSAFTQQWRTSYHFNTNAGKDVFFDLFAAELNALLHPNYTDEEIRREVRSFGVTTNPDGTLRLEERGSVYNEMVSSSANRYRVLFRALGHLTYGRNHPLAYNSGGEPSGIRTMKPEDIRNFHASNYYLANMGTLVAFPKSVALSEVLDRTDAILTKVESEPNKRESTTAKPFPAPQGAAPGTIVIAEWPNRNDQQPSPLAFVWPATRNLDVNELLLLELFAETFAGDATTNLYKLFIDSKTRVMDIGATSVFTNIERDLGQPVGVFLDNVAVANLNEAKIAEVREKVQSELARIANFADDSAELKEFNERALSRVIETERQLANLVNTPPAWGARGTGSLWMDQLLLLEKTSDFRKSVTLKPQTEAIRKQLASGKNIWRDALKSWQLVGVTPYAAAAKPSPALLQREEQERVARAEVEAQRLASQYATQLSGRPEAGTAIDIQEALKRYQKETDAEGARIEEEAKKIPPTSFVKNPPMTLDDELRYTQGKVESVPIVTSTFDNMSSATLGLALRADVAAREQLRYLSLLPLLLTRVGVIENGKPVSYEEMSERLRKEILRLDANFSTNPRTERVELVVRGAGLGASEAKRAIEWMSLVLHHPDWRPENLARIRDVVDQTLSGLRNTMQGSEESWVNNPANAYRMQQHPAYLAADSFLTRSHNALRLRWLLKDVPAEADRASIDAWFAATAAKTGTRTELKEYLATATLPLAKEVAKDLDLTLIEIPDSSLASDWAYLVNAIREDLYTPPSVALNNLDALRKTLLHRGNARLWQVSSSATQTALAPSVKSLAGSLTAGDAAPRAAAGAKHVDARLLARDANAKDLVYVGLLAPNMKGGVIITSVPSAHFADFNDKEKQLDYLASRLYAGAGAHGIFLKTLANGLAYSNGLRGTVQGARAGYYAERTPEIPQTVKFVVDTLKSAERDPRLAEYAVAQVFGETRAGATYEVRAELMANDLADQQTPDQVRKFRASILELRKDPNLGNTLFDRKDAVYGRGIPGYNVKGKDVPGAIYFTIGPDKQLDAWEAYLKNAEGAETKLWRLYPRDFWMP